MATARNFGAGDKIKQAFRVLTSPWVRYIALIVLISASALLAWKWQNLREEAIAGTAFAARTVCICRFVSNRPMEACKADLKVAQFGDIASMATLTENEQQRSITSRIPLLASQSADQKRYSGCQLEPWQE